MRLSSPARLAEWTLEGQGIPVSAVPDRNWGGSGDSYFGSAYGRKRGSPASFCAVRNVQIAGFTSRETAE